MTPTPPDKDELSEILFAQYQLGREHQRMSYEGEKRRVGSEITEAKQAINCLIAKERLDELTNIPPYMLDAFPSVHDRIATLEQLLKEQA